MAGGLTGARSARIAVSLSQLAPPGSRCHGQLRWRLHPARRLPVRDGSWRLRYANGEAATFKVSVGGRLATGIPLPSGLQTESCPVPSGTVHLFVGADRTASFAQPRNGLTVNLNFRSATRAAGTVSLGAEASCAARTVGLTAQLSR